MKPSCAEANGAVAVVWWERLIALRTMSRNATVANRS